MKKNQANQEIFISTNESYSENFQDGNSWVDSSTTLEYISNMFASYQDGNSKADYSNTYKSKKEVYKIREKELEKLLGKRLFNSLDKQSRDFLIAIEGILDFGIPIDIEKTFSYMNSNG